MMKKILSLLSLCFLYGNADADSWTQKANLGGSIRGASAGFSIGTKGYIGTGINFSSVPAFFNDFWEWNQATNTWMQKANFGGTARSGAVGFSIGSKGYLATGYDANIVTRDLWEYDPSLNTWTQKANYGGIGRDYAVAFSIGTKGYLGTGYNSISTNYNDFWEYNPSGNTWTQKANVPGGPRSSAIGFSINGKGYIGTGYDAGPKDDFYEYEPASNIWTQKANVPGGPRSDASAFAIGLKGYVCAGVIASVTQKDLWEYDPSSNTWVQKTNLTGAAREDAVGFSIGSKGYIGTGYDPLFNRLKDFWEYGPDGAPLPVELVEFTALKQNSSVLVQWTTAAESNNDYFTLEKSRDGFNFETIAEIKGHGSCSQENRYFTTDDRPFEGINYYRLRQADFNGYSTYSKTVSICMVRTDNPFKIYPGLFKDVLYFETNENDLINIQLISPGGKIIVNKDMTVESKMISKINIPDVAPGWYIITVKTANDYYSQKIIRQSD